MLPQPAIAVIALAKRYGPLRAVDAISFIVGQGRVTGLLGGNGAGKTTTLSMVLGLLLPTAGSVQVLGEDMVRHRHRVLPRINFSSPYADLPHRLTVAENLRVHAGLYGVRPAIERVQMLAEALDLTSFLRRPVGSLSAGQKTRVALAKALINEPELLVLDEPTASLDPDTADFVRGFLVAYRKRRDATILLASHNMAEVERLCDDVLMMKDGRIVESGSPEALLERHGRANLEEVFLDISRGRNGPAKALA